MTFAPARRQTEEGSLRKEGLMAGVRVLVGTAKGGFVLTSDGSRSQWDVTGPHFGGWEIYHMVGSPADGTAHAPAWTWSAWKTAFCCR